MHFGERVCFGVLLLLLWGLPIVSGQESPVPPIPDDLKFGFEITVMKPAYHGTKNFTQIWERKGRDVARLAEEFASEIPGAVRIPASKGTIRNDVMVGERRFIFSYDEGVIEVNPPPLTLETIPRELGSLFRAIERTGLQSQLSWGGIGGGGGHIHIDAGIFRRNPLLLRNLLVDLYNRPYVAAVLNTLGDHRNALGFREGRMEPAFLEMIRALDTRGIYSIKEFFELWDQYLRIQGGDRYVEVNLLGMKSHVQKWSNPGTPNTAEFRAIRVQHNVQDAYDTARLLHRYLDHLNRLRVAVPLLHLTPDQVRLMATPTVAGQRWRSFIEELGLSPERYERFVQTKFPLAITRNGDRRLEVRLMDLYRSKDAPTRYVYEIKVPDPSRMGSLTVNGSNVPLQAVDGTALGTFEVACPRGRIPVVEVHVTDRAGRVIAPLSGSWNLAAAYDTAPLASPSSHLPVIRSTLNALIDIEILPEGRRYGVLVIRTSGTNAVAAVRIGNEIVPLRGAETRIPLNTETHRDLKVDIAALDGSARVIASGRIDLVSGTLVGVPPAAPVSATAAAGRRLIDWKSGTAKPAPGPDRPVRADAASDPRLRDALALIERHSPVGSLPRDIVESIRSGQVKVWWVADWKRFHASYHGKAGAVCIGSDFYLQAAERSTFTIASYVVHEGVHALGNIRPGFDGDEPAAYREQSRFDADVHRGSWRGVKSSFRTRRLRAMPDVAVVQSIQIEAPHLYDARETTGTLDTVRRGTRSVGRGALAMGYFGGGALYRGAVHDRFEETLSELAHPRSLLGLAVFSSAHHLAERGVQAAGFTGIHRTLARFSLPTYAGVAAAHGAMMNDYEPRAVFCETVSLSTSLAALLPVDYVLRRTLIPVLLGSRWGKAGLAVAEIGKSAALLTGMELLDKPVRELFGIRRRYFERPRWTR